MLPTAMEEYSLAAWAVSSPPPNRAASGLELPDPKSMYERMA